MVKKIRIIYKKVRIFKPQKAHGLFEVKKEIIFPIVFIIVLFDQLSKFIVGSYLEVGESIAIIKRVFYITLTNNYGATFGLLKGYTWLFILFSFLIIGTAIYYWKDIPKKKYIIWMIALILAGAVGNLADRLVYGYVIDFIDFRIWPIFNIADLTLTIGCIGLIIYFWKS